MHKVEYVLAALAKIANGRARDCQFRADSFI